MQIKSASLSGLCTKYNLPFVLSNFELAINISSSVHLSSCLAIYFTLFSFIMPVPTSLYGGLQTTTSTLPDEVTLSLIYSIIFLYSFISLFKTEISLVKLFNLTFLTANHTFHFEALHQ